MTNSDQRSADPTTQEEYNRLYQERVRYFGYGIETGISMPCPFCCAPDFMVSTILDMEEAMKQGATCKNCQRSVKTVFHVNEPGNKQFEIVQTGGPDCTWPWLPPIRRV